MLPVSLALKWRILTFDIYIQILLLIWEHFDRRCKNGQFLFSGINIFLKIFGIEVSPWCQKS